MMKRRKKGKSADSGAVDGGAAAKSVDSSPEGQVNPRARLGEMLVQEGVITQGQLEEALKVQQEEGGFLGNTLVTLRYLDQNTLMSFLVKQCKIPHISLLDYKVDDELFKLVPRELCLNHLCIPIDRLGKILTVAMVNPFDADALESVRATCPDLKIKPILCDYNHFDQVARKYLKGSEASDEKDNDEVSAQSFGLTPSTSSKRAEKAKPTKRSTSAKTNDPETDSAEVASVEAAVNEDKLSARIEAALTTGLNEAIAPLLSTIESMQEKMESFGQPVAAATNVEAFPESSGKKKRRKAKNTEVLAASGVGAQGDDFVRGALLESPQCGGYSLDEFVAGPANADTESLVRSLLESPDPGFPPMYLAGGVGVGKTHLLHAIGNAYAEANPDIRIRRMTAGMFIRACESGAADGGVRSFLDSLSQADVFLLDDVHLFADRHDVQAVFAEVFDALHGAGRTMAVTGLAGSDELQRLNAQLQSRLGGSVVAMIKPPEFETRIEILRHLAGASDINLSDEILELLAESIKDDVRRLKGGFERVSAHVRAVGDDISVDDARDMIAQFDDEAVA